jgi:hypothetical protein
MGIMIPYASYNPTDAPIVKNAFTVALCNCSFSFFAGFGVFSIVGYLVGMGSQVADNISSIGLAFIAYPAALETLPGANFWTLMFSLTLFTLGIDSSFSIVEGVCTILADTVIGEKISKTLLVAILCTIGAIGSTLFCFNWGFTLFAIVDQYLNVYLVLLLGVLESLGSVWVHCFDDATQKASKVGTYVLVCGYWFFINVMPWPAYFGYVDESWASIPAFWGCVVVVWVVSFFTSRLSFVNWYNHVFFYGAMPIANHLVLLQKWKNRYLIAIFKFWWCFCIKYIVPWAIYWLIVMTMAANIKERYGNYYIGWQIIGVLIPVVGLGLFLFPICLMPATGDGSFKEAF